MKETIKEYNENLLHEFANNYMNIMKSKYKDLKGESLDDFLYDYENVLTDEEWLLGRRIVQLF
tara:strand:- start:5035 stop:5223 length:189 start_codon:yes stop_codon:yes gene_type:complete